MESKGGYLEKYPLFDWEPVTLFEKLFDMLMSAFAKNDLLRDFDFLETVHLISDDVNEQRVAIFQTT